MRTENSSIHSNKIQELTSSISAISKSTFKILLSCMLLLFLSLNLSGQSLNGAYTIGTSPSDFQTCTDAVNSLIQKGISGPVIFKLKSGTYTEQFSIPYIKGTENGNTISFESETGNKEDVILSFTANPAKNYIVLLDSAQQINFKNITLKPLSIANGTAVKLSRECRDITFENNNFTGLIPVTPTASLSLIMTAQDFKGINIQFTNNTFYGGLGGIYLGTKQQEYSLGTIIKNNTFQNQSNYAIYLASHDQLKVSSNKISSQSNENEYTGILLNFCYRSPEIKSNLINSKTGRGIHLYSCEGSSEKFALVANNMIMVSGGTWQIMGIYNDKSKYLSFLNNTILVNGSYSGNHGLASYSTSDSSVTTTLKVYNNIIINQSKGYSDAYAFAHAGKVECDYNNLMSNGTFLAYGYQNLADLQKGTKYDAHSYSQNPLFKSATDLHINKGLFKGTGFPFAEITDDIDGDVRPALPAIGADEFTPQGLNADLYKIILPQVPFTAGTHPIKVEVRNSGAGELTSLKIYWRLNAVMQNPVAWTGSLNTGSGTTVKLADFPFLPLVSYKVEAWVSEPNGGIDIETANDTILTPAFNTALSGNYSISKINGDFISFSEAAKRLVAGGITGPVNFNVAGGTYNEQFILKEIPGNSCDNMVTFQAAPSATVIIENYSGSANNYIIKLEKARGLTFKDLTIRPTNTNYGTAINIEKGASCISFLNNKIQGPQVNDRSVNTYLVTSTKDYFQYTGASSRINFKGNVFTGGTTAIDIPWESGYPDDSAIVIEDNQFSNQYYSVIEIQNQKSSIIKGNTISGSYYGIRISGNLSGFTIEKNKIATLGEAMTISSSSEKINSNGIIANNFISSISGISIYGLKEVRVYHNTVFGKGTRFYDYAFSATNCDTIKSYNNIFYGNGKYISSISTSKPELCHSDYNCYFTSGYGIFSFNSKETESFAEFQKISSQDKHSVFADPLFKSTEDLHVNKALLNNAGINIPEITTDIDNELRDQLPDIGADEFTPTGDDAGITGIIAPAAPFAKGEYPIKVVIKNYGISTLTSANINWEIEYAQQPIYQWKGTLKPGETDTVTIGNYNFQTPKIHTVSVWTELPNGTSDVGPSDDKFTRKDISPALKGIYIVGRNYDSEHQVDFTDLEYAINALKFGGISGPVTFTIQPDTYYDEPIITDFPGSSCDIPVIFKSENNDSTSVILRSYPDRENQYGVQLLGAKGITFQGITFESNGYEFTSNLLLSNGASCNKFINNVFTCIENNSGYYTKPVIKSDSESDSTVANINNHFENNLIKNGSHGFFMTGDSSKNENHGLVLKNNKLENQHVGGIYLKALNNVSVVGNSISGNTKLEKFPLPFTAIYIDKFKEYFTVTKNKIESDGIGIWVSNTNTSTKSALIANNFVVMKSTDTCQALQISNTENLNVYHNSVNILNTNTASTAFKTNNVKGIKVYNNNIVQTGGGSIFQIDNAATTTSDYNNLFTTGSKFANSTQEIGNLNTWIAQTGQDKNSVSINPGYISASDLHLSTPTLKRKGFFVPEVTRDIDNEIRNNVKPDLGADEYPDITTDASVLKLLSPSIPFAADTNVIKVTIANKGITTLTKAKINWSVNGVLQSPFNWSGNLEMGKTEAVAIGNYLFALNPTYKISAWTSNPNDIVDEMPANDTTTIVDLKTSLSGNYIIGAAPSDFKNIEDAVQNLKQRGVFAPTVFTIKKGTYTGQYILSGYTGSSCENTVTFKSENNDSTAVILTNESGQDKNYIIRLSGAKGIIIKNLTFAPSHNSYFTSIQIDSGSSCNQYTGNIFKGFVKTTFPTSSLVEFVYKSNLKNNSNIFLRNSFSDGAYGINQSSGQVDTGNAVIENTFTGQYLGGIIWSYQKDINISRNKIISHTAPNTSYLGIYLNGCISSNIEANKIIAYGGTGIYIYRSYSSDSIPKILSNNFISNTTKGISISDISDFKIINNTVLIRNNQNIFSSAFDCVNGYRLLLNNNIFANSGIGYSFTLDPYTRINSDYNNLYTAGKTLGKSFQNFENLKTWKDGGNNDLHSYSVNPALLSEFEPHIRNENLDDKGISTPYAKYDIDGELRNDSTPDIGADEFELPDKDAGISKIISPVMPFAAETQNIKMRLINTGLVPLKSATINWVVNDSIMNPFKWTGSLAVKDSLDLTIGTYAFNSSIPYSIKAWTSLPNAGSDNNHNNDTISTGNLYTALKGSYTIGETDSDFASIGVAAKAIELRGIIDTVLLNIKTGTYKEQVSIKDYIRNSTTSTAIFQSQTGNKNDVIIEYTPTADKNFVLQLAGADHLLFRNLSIQSKGSDYTTVLEINSNSNRNSFEGNNFTAPEFPTTSGNKNIVEFRKGINNAAGNYNTFKNNFLSGGETGISLEGSDISVFKGNRIEGNTFTNQKISAIKLSYQDSLKIFKNKIINSKQGTSYKGIYLLNSTGDISINENTVNLNFALAPALYRCDGIIFENVKGSENQNVLLINNFIYAFSKFSTNGIRLLQSEHVSVFHNTIHNKSTDPTSTCILTDKSKSLTIQNNIFANSGAGLAANYAALTDSDVTDYNCYFATGNNLISLAGKSYNDFTRWKSIAQKDSHSLVANPFFKTDTEFQIREIALKNRGIKLPEVSTDIEGDLRDQKPDIGADEFSPDVSVDAGIASLFSEQPLVEGKNQIRIILKNYGKDTLRTVIINSAYNKINQPSYKWLGVLGSGKEDTITLSSINILPVREYNLKFWSSQPNDIADTYNYNDTINANNLYASLNGTYTIGGIDPDFISFSEAAQSLKYGGITGPVLFKVYDGVYNEQVIIPEVRGANSTNRITFKGESGDSTKVILKYTPQTYTEFTMQLNGADFINFQNLTISAADSRATTILLSNTCENISFKNNSILGSSGWPLVTIGGVLNEKIEFLNNHFVSGSNGIKSTSVNGISIRNNVFSNQHDRGVNLEYFNSAQITDNRFENKASYDYAGIYLGRSNDKFLINGNYFSIKKEGFGISLYDMNTVDNAIGLVTNNSIYIAGYYKNAGIKLENCTNIDLVYNSVLVKGAGENSGYALFLYYCSKLNILNNNFINLDNSYSLYTYYSQFKSDHNNFYSNGSKFIYSSGEIRKLEDWISSTGLDKHSFSIDPKFVSDTNLRFTNTALDSSGVFYQGVTSDITNAVRNKTFPDLGAYELVNANNDIGLLPATFPSLACNEYINTPVEIGNFGSNDLNGFRIAYSINNGVPVIEEINDTNFLSGRTYQYKFRKPVRIERPGIYKIKIYTVLTTDEISSNDTLSFVISKPEEIIAESWEVTPVNKSVGMNLPINLYWPQVKGTDGYNLNIWNASDSLNEHSSYQNLKSRLFPVYRDNPYGKTYNWQITSANPCYEVKSPVFTFSIEAKPDLITVNAKIPLTAFSGQSIEVGWETRNTGDGKTFDETWTDKVYLSKDTIFDAQGDILLNELPNLTSLNSDEAYSRTTTVTIPQGLNGKFYLLAVADPVNRIIEFSETNNVTASRYPITITLTPPPDLQVTRLIVPQNAFSGDKINITYTIANKGVGSTKLQSWYDRIVISDAPIYTGKGYNMGSFQNLKSLSQDSTYSRTVSLTLPQNISGRYYFYLITDDYNQIYEHAYEENNIKQSDSVKITLTPPADLVASSIIIPASASINDTIDVEWTVKNDGAELDERITYWYDYVYLDTSANFNPAKSKPALKLRQLIYSMQKNTYTAHAKLVMASSFKGKYYLHIFSNAGKDIFEVDYLNNTTTSDSIFIYQPDLVVENVKVSTPSTKNNSLDVNWTVVNKGKGKVKSGKSTDKIYISASSVFTLKNSKLLDSLNSIYTLASNDLVNRTKRIIAPGGLSGTYYIHVITDTRDSIPEANNENNSANSQGINFQFSPWADLIVTDFSITDTIQSLDDIPIRFTVKNIGVSETGVEEWKDLVYISNDSVITSESVLLRESVHAGSLSAGAAYTINSTIQLPSSLRKGIYYIHIITDGKNNVDEYTNEGNNAFHGKQIYLKHYPPVDLSVVNAGVSGELATGKTLDITWKVQNNGKSSTTYYNWNDRIYLSADTIFSESDYLLYEYTNDRNLGHNGFYEIKKQIQLPVNMPGTFYFIVVTDAKKIISDYSISNNQYVIADTSGHNFRPFTISFTAPADLVITSAKVPGAFESGQIIDIAYTVSNKGSGTTMKNTWSDYIYISEDSLLSYDDQILESYYRNTDLDPEKSYNVKLSSVIQDSKSPYFFLIIKTDVSNNVFENKNEDNNTFVSKIHFTIPPPSDLIVTNIIIPDSVENGSQITAEWDIFNAGNNLARGRMKEAAYFSEDTIWDISDILAGSYDLNLELGKLATLKRKVNIVLPGLKPVKHYLIVRTDINNNIYESSDSNNTSYSREQMNIAIQKLTIGEIAKSTLNNGDRIYFKIEVPKNLEGESLLILLKGNTAYSANELFVSHDKVPGRMEHDFAFDNPFEGDQEIVVPELKAGFYYLEIIGNTTSGSSQEIQLKARVLNFVIKSVHSSKGGNTGDVTIQIKGSKFDPSMNFSLVKDKNNINAKILHFINPTLAYATFNLSGSETGVYDVVGLNYQGDTASYSKGFEIVKGGDPQLLTHIIAPVNVRTNNLVSITIDFVNSGENDIVSPVITLSNTGGAAIAFSERDLKMKYTSLKLNLTEENGPEGILRPGASGSIIIYSRQPGYLRFFLKTPKLKFANSK